MQKTFHVLRVAILISSGLSLQGCWAAVAGAGAEAGYIASQEDRTAGETVSDQLLVTRVKSTLIADSDVPGLSINVDSYKGEITLRGYVTSEEVAAKAVHLASQVNGVKSVVSKLVIEAPKKRYESL